VDAVIGAFRNFELNQMALDKRPGIAFYPEENGVPAYDELILIAHKTHADPQMLRAFNRALEDATLYVINHPQDAWETFVAHHPELNDTLNKRAWQDTLPRFALRPGALDRARYARFATFMQENGLIQKTVPIESYAIVVK
jgi:putative hydroxymethylpyrimidine transport system substrate-binding protein